MNVHVWLKGQSSFTYHLHTHTVHPHIPVMIPNKNVHNEREKEMDSIVLIKNNDKIDSQRPKGCVWMWMANYKCQCRSLQSLPSLWEFTEPSAVPERLTFCSEYKMLIHAAGNLELGKRAILLPSSLSLAHSLSYSIAVSLSQRVMSDSLLSYHGTLCSLSLSDVFPVYSVAAPPPPPPDCWPDCRPRTPWSAHSRHQR